MPRASESPAVASAPDAEAALLGSVLIDPSLLGDVCGAVQVGDFFVPDHIACFRAMRGLLAENRAVDPVALSLRLREHVPDPVGLLYRLADTVPVASRWRDYAEEVRLAARIRQVESAARDALAACGRYGSASPRDLLDTAIRAVGRVGLAADVDPPVSASALFPAVLDDVRARAAQPERSGGLAVGLRSYDELTGGLFPGEVTVLAARPGMGKSALAVQWAVELATRGWPALYCSLELGRAELAARVLCSWSRVSFHRLRCGALGATDLRALAAAEAAVREARFTVDDRPTLGLAELAALVDSWRGGAAGPAVVFIDYLQLMSASNPREPREQQVAGLSRGIKALARRAGVAVVLLAQLNRQVDQSGDKKPRLSHLRESGSIEADADVVSFVHRPEYYDRQAPALRGVVELLVEKNRNGPTGTAEVRWQCHCGRFFEATDAEAREPQAEIPF